MTVAAIPEGFNSITPYLTVADGAKAIEFYQQALDAELHFSLPMPDGKIGHAELKIGNSMIMLADEFEEEGNTSPTTLGGNAMTIMLYVADCDAVFAQALAAGGSEVKPMADQFYGDRSGTFKDPFGHVWTVGTHKEDLTPDEIAARMANMG